MQVPVCEQECLLRPSICTSDHLGCCLEGQFGSGRVDISMNKTVVLHMVRGSCGVGDVPGCTTECWCRASGTWYPCGACACCCLRRVFVCWFVLRVGVYAWYAAPLAQLKVGCIFILTQPIPSRLWLRYYTAFLLIFFRIILCDLILIHAVAASN